MKDQDRDGLLAEVLRNQYTWPYRNTAMAAFHSADLDFFIQVLQKARYASMRAEGARRLGDLRDPAAAQPLIKALQRDRSLVVRQQSARALGKLGDVAAIPPLTEALRTETNPVFRQRATYALFVLGANERPSFTRFIEFPPQYAAAGMQILTHFKEIVRSKYSDSDVKIIISQENKTVTMTVEADDGERLDRIERTFEDYGLVVQGDLSIDEFLDGKGAILRLENRLGLVEHELRMEQRINAYLDGDLAYHKRLLADSIAAMTARGSTTVYAQATATSSPSIGITQCVALSGLQGALAHLAENLPEGSEERADVEEISSQINDLPSDPAQAKRSPVFNRMRRFVEEVSDEESRLNKTIRGIKNASAYTRDVVKLFQEVAQWVNSIPSG